MITGTRSTVKLARKLRSEMTLPEGMLWRELRNRPDGFKFRRQHPAGEFVIDFFCAILKLAIEVDGSAHDCAQASRKDARRSQWLREHGIATLGVPASAVLNDIEAVVVRVGEVCRERNDKLADRRCLPLHQTASGPPPRTGEE